MNALKIVFSILCFTVSSLMYTVAEAQTWQCDASGCRIIPATRSTPMTVRTASILVENGQPVFDPVPIQQISSSREVSSANCGCALTGECNCLPGTCNCSNCTCRMQQTASSDFPTTPVNERVFSSPSGHVHVFSDQSGNTMTSHSGDHVQRKVSRQERWRARNGVR